MEPAYRGLDLAAGKIEQRTVKTGPLPLDPIRGFIKALPANELYGLQRVALERSWIAEHIQIRHARRFAYPADGIAQCNADSVLIDAVRNEPASLIAERIVNLPVPSKG